MFKSVSSVSGKPGRELKEKIRRSSKQRRGRFFGADDGNRTNTIDQNKALLLAFQVNWSQVESTLVKLNRKSKLIFKDHHPVSCVSLYSIVASKSTKDMFMRWSNAAL